ncbi:hypothetical protein E2C01_033644 [Portunus trituberculatus]|uniref:Uncharacterized protein n=1 Tax=Portunus trituberculatus TaxID=210409 RepID=A0A5B7EZD6_PORTR|nr:hypothetical protein [Portunus trituberculatus]
MLFCGKVLKIFEFWWMLVTRVLLPELCYVAVKVKAWRVMDTVFVFFVFFILASSSQQCGTVEVKCCAVYILMSVKGLIACRISQQ